MVTDLSRTTAVEQARITSLRAAYTKSLVTAALALKWYRCEKGQYPKTLQELVPQYLKQLPVDPTDGSQLVYERQANDSFRLSMPASSKYEIRSKMEFLR